jgi:hypothetical protein
MQMGVLIRMKIYLLYLSIEDKKNHCCPIKLFSEEVRGQI